MVGSPDICLGTKYFTLVQFGTESPTQSRSTVQVLRRSHEFYLRHFMAQESTDLFVKIKIYFFSKMGQIIHIQNISIAEACTLALTLDSHIHVALRYLQYKTISTFAL